MTKDSIKLGDKVRDVVTGFSGVVVARNEFINGCVQYGVSPKADKDKMHDCQWIDWQRLEVTGKPVKLPYAKKESTGGPSHGPRGMK